MNSPFLFYVNIKRATITSLSKCFSFNHAICFALYALLSAARSIIAIQVYTKLYENVFIYRINLTKTIKKKFVKKKKELCCKSLSSFVFNFQQLEFSCLQFSSEAKSGCFQCSSIARI